jgi:hypothetical protein
MLEIRDTKPSEYESEISSSERYCSCSSNKSKFGLEISFSCEDTCCKTIGVMTKEEEQEELLLDLISKIENHELKRQYLEKLRKLLTKREVAKSKSPEVSLNTLKRFNKPKKQITINDLQLEVNQIKSEIKILKEENQELKQDVNLLKIEHKLKSAASSHNDSEAKPEPKPEDTTSQFEENCLSIINRIHIRKWYSKVKIKIQDFELSVVVLINTGADLNCIQEGLVPTKYYSKSKETLRSTNGSKM